MPRRNSAQQQGAIGPPRGVEVVTVASDIPVGGAYRNEEGGEFAVQVLSAGNIAIVSAQGDEVTFSGLDAGDTVTVATVPLLCSAVQRTGTTVTSFYAVFLA